MTKTALPIIYIVDDNPYDIDLIKLGFDDMRQKALFKTAKDGVEAVDYAKHLAENPLAERPQLILLDLNMPRMGGMEALEIIRAMPIFRKIPIVILTTSESPKDKSRCLALGATAYIIKSHRLDDFFLSLRQLLPYLAVTADEAPVHNEQQPPPEPLNNSYQTLAKTDFCLTSVQMLTCILHACLRACSKPIHLLR